MRLKITHLLTATALMVLFAPQTLAAENFSAMNPTVKVVSYKKLFTGQLLAMGSGSGTVLTSDGLILTNNHVIFDDGDQEPLDAFGICITFSVEKEPVCRYTASLIANNKDMDVALLKIDSEDVFGKNLPALKFINLENGSAPKEGTNVQVIGYPGSGGETVTITTGKISGFDKFNNFTYFKTDTDFDHGSSGGTVLDSEGNFIGVPTYIRSYAENVGYFLDLREARSWINENRGKTVEADKEAEAKLSEELARFEKANDELKFTYGTYPKVGITLPEGWKFLEINDTGLYAQQEKQNDAAYVSLFIESYPYEIEEGYLKELDEQLAPIKEIAPDYKKEKTTFAGEDAIHISYTRFNSEIHAYYVSHGYSLVGVTYSYNLDEKEKQEKALKPVLDSIGIGSKATNVSPDKPTISFKEPAFEITAPKGWLIQKNISGQPMHLLASAVQDNNYKGSLDIYYSKTPKDELVLSLPERLDSVTKNITGGDQKLILKKDDLVIDGLKGWLYVYEYEGSKYQEIKKRMVVTLQHGDYEFRIEYNDLDAVFEKNLEEIQDMLKSFTLNGEREDSGQYEIGTLERQFSDIQHHRFAASISALAEKGIVGGYEDGTFRPEAPVTRAEALKIILESKNHLEEERGLGKELDFAAEANGIASNFRDVGDSDWFSKYVRYANHKKFLEGYGNNTFGPNRTINLAEALKIIFGVYEIPLWNGQTNPWYKLYMDKGYDLYLIPRGMENPATPLTRAELADIVDSVYSQAK